MSKTNDLTNVAVGMSKDPEKPNTYNIYRVNFNPVTGEVGKVEKVTSDGPDVMNAMDRFKIVAAELVLDRLVE